MPRGIYAAPKKGGFTISGKTALDFLSEYYACAAGTISTSVACKPGKFNLTIHFGKKSVVFTLSYIHTWNTTVPR